MVNQTLTQFCTHWLGCLFLLTGFVGCGGSAVVELLVPVSGAIKFDGEAVEGAVVAFIPTGKNTRAHAGTGLTDSDGQFEISNFQRKKGLPAGEYIVTVSLKYGPDGEVISADDRSGPIARREVIPAPWNQITKAGRHNNVIVPAEGRTDFEFSIPKAMSDDPASEDRRSRAELRTPQPGGAPKPTGK